MARSDARALVGIVATVVLGALQVLVQIAETPPSWLSPVLWGLIVLALAYTLWSFLPSFRKPVEQTWRTRPRVIRSQTWTDYQDLLVARESDREQIGASLLLVRKSAELSHIEKGHPYVDLTIVLTNAALEPVIVHGISGHINSWVRNWRPQKTDLAASALGIRT